jgi:hypothetical protein
MPSRKRGHFLWALCRERAGRRYMGRTSAELESGLRTKGARLGPSASLRVERRPLQRLRRGHDISCPCGDKRTEAAF